MFEVKLVTTVTPTNKTITKRKYPYKKTPQNAPLERALSVKGGLVNLAPRCLGVGDATVPIYCIYTIYRYTVSFVTTYLICIIYSCTMPSCHDMGLYMRAIYRTSSMQGAVTLRIAVYLLVRKKTRCAINFRDNIKSSPSHNARSSPETRFGSRYARPARPHSISQIGFRCIVYIASPKEVFMGWRAICACGLSATHLAPASIEDVFGASRRATPSSREMGCQARSI